MLGGDWQSQLLGVRYRVSMAWDTGALGKHNTTSRVPCSVDLWARRAPLEKWPNACCLPEWPSLANPLSSGILDLLQIAGNQVTGKPVRGERLETTLPEEGAEEVGLRGCKAVTLIGFLNRPRAKETGDRNSTVTRHLSLCGKKSRVI